MLSRFAELIAEATDGLTLLLEMTVAPGTGPCMVVVPVWSGDPQGADAAVGKVMRLGARGAGAVASTTQKDLWAQFDQAVPNGMHWDLRTRNIAELTPDVISLLTGWVEKRPGPGAGIGLRQFHGAATRVGTEESAFGLRTSHVAVEISAGRGPDEDHGSFKEWLEGVYNALAPFALPGGATRISFCRTRKSRLFTPMAPTLSVWSRPRRPTTPSTSSPQRRFRTAAC
ncbi:FAD linked oxidase domain protein [Streptomyces malaysiensis]|uniref:FAD linked oxidase domain protein n=1 Tax=Streptomyces malaysiensis TaxID=92644 RepID=A0A7X5X6N6_STRMQ|nr:FAD linked oxidase domain protein [Streptomyces malaysiensis]